MPRNPLRLDENELAFRVVQASIGEGPRPQPPGAGDKNPEAVARGRLGGVKGGKARANALSDRKRKAIAKKGGRARAAKLKK
jgi:hypothetical protein